MAAARRWLRAVLYRPGMQFGWLWVAVVAWFAVLFLPDGRWNRTFDGRAIATITSIHSDGAENPDLLIEYVFRANGREYTNHGIDDDAPRDIVEGRELEVAYVTSDPRFSELRAPGVRSRYGPLSRDLIVLGVFALVGVGIMIGDRFGARRERTNETPAQIQERTAPAIWFLFLLPAAVLVAVATLIVRYILPS